MTSYFHSKNISRLKTGEMDEHHDDSSVIHPRITWQYISKISANATEARIEITRFIYRVNFCKQRQFSLSRDTRLLVDTHSHLCRFDGEERDDGVRACVSYVCVCIWCVCCVSMMSDNHTPHSTSSLDINFVSVSFGFQSRFRYVAKNMLLSSDTTRILTRPFELRRIESPSAPGAGLTPQPM